MNLVITKWQPAQLKLHLPDASYSCEIVDVRVRQLKKRPVLFVALVILKGMFAGQIMHIKFNATIQMSRTLFDALGIVTANGISVDIDMLTGKRLMVDVTRNDPAQMYENITGFRQVTVTERSDGNE